MNTDELILEMRKACVSIFIGAEEAVAQPVSMLFVEAIKALRQKSMSNEWSMEVGNFSLSIDSTTPRWVFMIDNTGKITLNPDIPQEELVQEFIRICSERLQARYALKVTDEIERLQQAVAYWQTDSAAAWDKCEERRKTTLEPCALLAEIDQYLSRSPDEAIHSGSVLHRKIKQEINSSGLTKRACQHDLLAPNPTVTVHPADPFAAHCDVCGYKWKTRTAKGERSEL